MGELVGELVGVGDGDGDLMEVGLGDGLCAWAGRAETVAEGVGMIVGCGAIVGVATAGVATT